MADPNSSQAQKSHSPPSQLEQGTYEIIRHRLNNHGSDLRARLQKLNEARKEVFGAIQTSLIATERITTQNKCLARDMISIGRNHFLFGYNVHLGLKSEVQISDVFAVYELREHHFHELNIEEFISDPAFLADFQSLYKYYKNTFFTKFSIIGPHLFMVFQVGKSATDIKTFKWLLNEGKLNYLGNRSDHEYSFPSQHGFEWKRTHRDLHRSGFHPHISIEDKVFVETIGGDLTIKVEDNTDTGEGIYSEPVEIRDQTLDDAEIYYAVIGNLVLMKIRPYQEKKFRYLVFNEKIKQVKRIDGIENSCVLLPDGQGIIYSKGYYHQSGECKEFESNQTDMLFENRVQAANGEDYLHTFYNRERGDYILMSYNIIEQKVEAPLLCDGYSLFENGELALFRGDPEPQKHHVVQIWQTPYATGSLPPAVKKDSYLFKIGNPDLVTCMAECHEVLNLISKDDSYANLYVDLVKQSGDILDAYFWIDKEETFNLKAPLAEIKGAATSALEEFDKVVRIRRNTENEVRRITQSAQQIIKAIPYNRLNEIILFVHSLAELRKVRGEVITLKDLRYVDLPAVECLEKEVAEHTRKLSVACVEFLLKEEALFPYRDRIAALQHSIQGVQKVADARKLEEEVSGAAKELEMLIDVVSNLKIEDATQTTRIIESISAIYSTLNQAKSSLKERKKHLHGAEAVAEFGSQMRLLSQAVVNYLDLCETSEKCDEYLTKLMVQVEELEGRFTDFEDFIVQLSEKRTELASAFESRKLALVEARNKKSNALLTAADRIIKGIKHRVEGFKTINEINGYYASDLMIDKVRDLVKQLVELGDTVKADDIQSRLKTVREDAVRQLKDRQDLFVEGQNIIRFGKHQFSVNTQELELTIVNREGDMYLHLIGTNFFEKIQDEALLSTRSVWNQEMISENAGIYRGEYLAYQCFVHLQQQSRTEDATRWSAEERLNVVQQFMSPRYAESYVKGVHDLDASSILGVMLEIHSSVGLLRYAPQARACAAVFWAHFQSNAQAELLKAKIKGIGALRKIFDKVEGQAVYVSELKPLISDFATRTGLFDCKWIEVLEILRRGAIRASKAA